MVAKVYDVMFSQREQEQKTTYARLHKLIDDVKELQTTNKELQEAVDAAKAETAAARLEAVAKTTVKTAPANAAPSEELDAALAKISMLQSEVGELQPLGMHFLRCSVHSYFENNLRTAVVGSGGAR